MSVLSLVSWNIHGFVGADGRANVERTGGVLQRLAPDIAGLQEVDLLTALPGGGDRLERLSRMTGLHATFGPTRGAPPRAFGNALLTRWPVTNVEYVDVSMGSREPRAILSADLPVQGTTLRVMVTHFGLRAAERRAQIGVLFELVTEKKRGPVLLMGDFNEWRPRARAIEKLDEAFGRAPRPRTFPARLPVFALDRIWVDPRRALLALDRDNDPSARLASDHLPVIARVDIDQ